MEVFRGHQRIDYIDGRPGFVHAICTAGALRANEPMKDSNELEFRYEQRSTSIRSGRVLIQSRYSSARSGYIPTPQPVVRRQRSFWATAPATYVLVGINVAVFLLMLLRHVSGLSPSPEQLMHWGANNAGSVLVQGEWWRILTAMFVHVGIIHLATNMWCLWNLGLLAEPLMGSFGVVAVYVLTGAAGNLLSVLWNGVRYNVAHVPHLGFDPLVYFPPGAGASGAVFGIAGALIVLLKSPRLPVPPEELKKLRKSVIYFAAINLVIGLTISLDYVSSKTGISVDNRHTWAECCAGCCLRRRWFRGSGTEVGVSNAIADRGGDDCRDTGAVWIFCDDRDGLSSKKTSELDEPECAKIALNAARHSTLFQKEIEHGAS